MEGGGGRERRGEGVGGRGGEDKTNTRMKIMLTY